MADAQRREAAADEQTEGFSNKPVMLADNGHGTKVKLWLNDGPGQNGIPNVAIERSFKREGSEQWETHKVSLNASDLLAVARALEKGHDAIVEKQIGKKSSQTRA